ncbi:uncharacterized protein LOC117319711 [Pecten maximus]|uniref:uncharacterized protein LOC117319711 n=1 Tax=Pecten maximus TaxID=6579 RepID=UPI001459126A|nr:uncharacterized protein LOC117319711 [Pecten maximus]
MMNSVESEQMSLLLSTYLERRYTGTEEIVNIKRRAVVLDEQLMNSDFKCCIHTGSFGEGCLLKGSDMDAMVVDKTIAVMYPDQCIPQHLAHKTILYMRQADCRPGYVHLEIGQLKGLLYKAFTNSLVRMGKSVFISSDIFREECVSNYATRSGLKCESNGPSSTFTGMDDTGVDMVHCFPCNSWPKEANEWITRTRLYGWPHQTLIDKIVNSGCHLVPVGDKCSNDTFLQWRISLAAAERSLVHSLSHIQVKVYTLLKYFLKQIKETLKETIGDDDILCSYFMKTILFHAIENSNQLFWQDKHLFYCFWFCFNILIAWVRTGFCPNYFILANNLFQRKVHGHNKQILLDLLDNYSRMKWMCLSVGNFVKPSIWEVLCDISTQAQLACPKTAQENIMDEDRTTLCVLLRDCHPSLRMTRTAIYLLSTSKSDFDEVHTYFFVTDNLRCFASQLISKDISENRSATDNKTRYRRLRKCKHWMTPRALMGTDVLYLATLHFLTGNFNKCLEMSRQVMKLASYFRHDNEMHPELHTLYRHQDHLPNSCTLQRLRTIYTKPIHFEHEDMYLPHLCLELSKEYRSISIPPLPYVLFLNFLCHHDLGDTRGRDEALRYLIQVQYDKDQGGQIFWIVHTLLGICHQILGDYHRAIRAYWESAQSKDILHEWNTARERIAIVYLCMYISQRSDRG